MPDTAAGLGELSTGAQVRGAVGSLTHSPGLGCDTTQATVPTFPGAPIPARQVDQ